MNHPTQQELLEYAVSEPGDPRFAETAGHLSLCPRCRSALGAVRAVEKALHRLPVEHPSPEFTRKLMRRLGLRESTPIWWMFLKNFAPVLAAGLVAAAVVTLGSPTPGGAGPEVRNPLFDTRSVTDAVRLAVDGFSGWTAAIASKYLSFTLGPDASSLVMFLCILFAGIGLLDRFLLGPMLRRKNY